METTTTVHYSKDYVTTQQPVSVQPSSQINLVVRQPTEWSSGLFDCCQDPLSAVVAWLFLPCYTCFLSHKLGESCMVPCCVCCSMVTLRTMVRTKHSIPGSVMNDCCTTCWCSCCAATQMARHQDAVTPLHPIN